MDNRQSEGLINVVAAINVTNSLLPYAAACTSMLKLPLLPINDKFIVFATFEISIFINY